jgi:hypothetical protein
MKRHSAFAFSLFFALTGSVWATDKGSFTENSYGEAVAFARGSDLFVSPVRLYDPVVEALLAEARVAAFSGSSPISVCPAEYPLYFSNVAAGIRGIDDLIDAIQNCERLAHLRKRLNDALYAGEDAKDLLRARLGPGASVACLIAASKIIAKCMFDAGILDRMMGDPNVKQGITKCINKNLITIMNIPACRSQS